MAKVREVCSSVRSKNAGPYWVTIDMVFRDDAAFETYAHSPELGRGAFARLYEVPEDQCKLFLVPSLRVLKVSFPRRHPQGGMVERDMHAGQQYVRLLDLELGEGGRP
jgi:hypothetical protein